MEQLTRADVVKMLQRINELTSRVLILEAGVVKKTPVKRSPKK